MTKDREALAFRAFEAQDHKMRVTRLRGVHRYPVTRLIICDSHRPHAFRLSAINPASPLRIRRKLDRHVARILVVRDDGTMRAWPEVILWHQLLVGIDGVRITVYRRAGNRLEAHASLSAADRTVLTTPLVRGFTVAAGTIRAIRVSRKTGRGTGRKCANS